MGLLPCPTCPWRVDQKASSIPRYNHDLACDLLKTVGDGDDFRTIMACHGSPTEEPYACNGYLARAGWSNINVRMLLRLGSGIASPDDVLDACERAGIVLHEDYHEVLEKLKRSR